MRFIALILLALMTASSAQPQKLPKPRLFLKAPRFAVAIPPLPRAKPIIAQPKWLLEGRFKGTD